MLSTQKTLFGILIISIALLFSACDSGHDHGDVPVGLVLLQQGSEVVIQDSGTVTYVNGNAIEVTTGQTSELFTVEFIDEDGNRYVPEGNEYGLIINIANESILTDNHPGSEGRWSFTLNGITDGSTTIQFELFHVDHSDFRTQNFNVVVSSATE
jgi:hypothetical protein